MKKVAVGMSGGVDSSVAALLLKEQGYEVIGITLKLSSIQACEDIQVCCSPQDVKDAKKVASYLGIQHFTIDWEKDFKDKVIDYFINDLKEGKTPNPCSICNREIKTGRLYKYVKAVLGIDYLATGHYINTVEIEGQKLIKRGIDKNKDQSYFMALVEKEVINGLIFPLGNLTKEKTREIAGKYKLPVSKKKDSFEICFTAGKTPAEYIQETKSFELEEGDIYHISGKKLGKHKGIAYYTIGQRRGLGIRWNEPLYVLDKIPEKNILIVGENKELLTDFVETINFNFHLPIEKWQGNLKVQGRYRQKPVDVEDFSYKDGVLKVKFKQPQIKFASGQILAVYKDDILLGGGIIK
ncbi:tRNA 2-thiouridine(34) synthase MnmA [Hydrogenothermus marinus]|uniref:tRNA-specific 2-thiouridylase MnmA n=1 Tax=Hydrogenothermus marinus TaxID=133270 RepID=A0A3M0BKZ6_9AQUI|nr:tRNA 2-thiouridine(34) synthase MnmA [Hydrogenothermus marinus]RMA97104.1 tRNA-specific 2-thiouridylase [Hydrogenothermus marinus]